jgi:GTP cyclohydrolase I
MGPFASRKEQEMEQGPGSAAERDNVIELSAAAHAGPHPWSHLSKREISPEDWQRYRGYVAEIFSALGMELGTPGTRDTPERYLAALRDATLGYEGDPKLLTAFPAESRPGPESATSQIIEGPIGFQSLCEHHALPFHGFAHIGYVAGERIIGISKLTRLVRLFARRFTVQERLGEQIADALVQLVEPRGVAVHLEASHLCTQMRGVEEEGSRTATTFYRGSYDEDADLRREFLAQVRGAGR